MDGVRTANWIAVDWGTSHLRAYAMQGATKLAHAQSDDGMGRLARSDFAPALEALIAEWSLVPALPTIACGMIGSRQGWVEAPYRAVPCTPLAADLIRAPGPRPVWVVPGLSQASPCDVMRGEETQITGFLKLNPGWDGVLCLPGTHTKWVHLSAGEVVSFQTFMTGELFALLGQASVLRHTVSDRDWSPEAFSLAVTDTMSAPERVAARLFGLRATDLLQGLAPGHGRAALSGYLIGLELAAARPYWLGQNLAILSTGPQARAYQTGLAAQGAPAMLVDSERATLAGLTAAYRLKKETS